MTKQCQTCQSVYTDLLPDGTRYFHACPPYSAAELQALIASGKSPLSPAQQAAYTAAAAAPVAVAPPVGYVPPVAVVLATITIERANKRDENIDPAKLAAAPRDEFGNVQKSVTADALMKSVGLGAAEVLSALV